MSDMSSMNRELKKRQLKRQMVSTGSLPPERGGGEEAAGREKPKRRRRLRIFAVVLAVVVLSVLAVLQYLKIRRYTDYSVAWEKPVAEGSFVGYINFGSNVIKYSRDGAKYYDSRGKEVWVQSYEMKSPIASVSGGYAAVADQQGNQIYIFDKSGILGEITTQLPILKMAVSSQGTVAVVQEDAGAGYINVLSMDGTTILTIKGILDKDAGYPMDADISPDGAQVIGAYALLNGGELTGRVAVHDFSEIGKNIPTRLVGVWDDQFGSGLVPRVAFLKSPYSCAFSDQGVTFFSSENAMSPQPIAQVRTEDRIVSVMYSDDYVGLIMDNPLGEDPSRLEVYKSNGDKVFTKTFRYAYSRAEIDGDMVILSNENSCELYSMKGIRKFSGAFDFAVSKIRKGKLPNTYLVIGPQYMKEIKLK